MRARVVLVIPVLLGLVPVLVQCQGATEMVVEVSTDLPCPKHGGTSIAVGKLGELEGRSPAALATTCSSDGTIGSLVVVPSGENDEALAFQVTTGIGVDPSGCTSGATSCIVARRRLRFLPHERLSIRVPMKQACAGVVCDPSSTCFDGRCVTATIDTGRCVSGVCGEDALVPAGAADASTPSDASAPSDATSPVDAAPDAPTGTNLLTTLPAGFDMVFGEDDACMLLRGDVYCWGTNESGQVGIGAPFDATLSEPQRVGDLSNVVAIAAGVRSTMGAITADGRVFLWGQPEDSLVLGASAPATRPTKMPVASARRLCIGTSNACTITDDTHLECWGTLGTNGGVIPPTSYDLGAAIADLGCGYGTTIVRMADQTVWTGGVLSPILGRGDAAIEDPKPVAIPGMKSMAGLIAYGELALAWEADAGNSVAWGDSKGGEVQGTFGEYWTPFKLGTPWAGYSRLVRGIRHVCGLRAGKVECWGSNEWGQLAVTVNDLASSAAPVKVTLPGEVDGLWAGGGVTCAHVVGRTIYCWGANDFGQLGVGTIDPGIEHPIPTPLRIP